jgi:hypothetical protein
MSDEATIKTVDENNFADKYGILPLSPSIKLRKLRYNNGAVKFFNSTD